MLDIVIVLFNPCETFLISNLKKIIDSPIVGNVFYIDNSNSTSTLFNQFNEKVKYVPLKENYGIAKAQNVGLKMSLSSNNSDVVVMFDQDSILTSQLLESLYSDYCNLSSLVGCKLAAMGPNIIDSFSGKEDSVLFSFSKKQNIHSDYEIKREIIASGKVINKKALLDVGFMEEELFIDGVDHEWCWRASSKGYQVYISKYNSMVHTVGDARKKIGPLTLRVSSPIRMYYQYRNYFALVSRGYVPFYWKLRNLVGYFMKFIVFGFLVKDSKVRRRYMLIGLKDGVCKVVGKYHHD
ncbi:glycosyltransferase family 2 protein [Shewanella baltica]|uniref:glycosyltransferase family 2 protein n=1 Tax=Shewanella baltica TaxID=62322 RepID=UPI00217E2615|nr:glycosyltransferase family 2 protein [Shewanella baltica]MCS6175145.1 glycosyltransferase family 2 protein [Shewanella baltica]